MKSLEKKMKLSIAVAISLVSAQFNIANQINQALAQAQAAQAQALANAQAAQAAIAAANQGRGNSTNITGIAQSCVNDKCVTTVN